MRVGPHKLDRGGYAFTVWAPLAERVEVEISGPSPRRLALAPAGEGYWRVETQGVRHGTHYRFSVDGGPFRPDPASHYQPEGVHGPSAVVAHDLFAWSDEEYTPPPFSELVLYELHVGTFTRSGTFDEAASRLDHLTDLGVNAVELMPVAQFPGDRNWGYDGVFPYAVQHSYGGPEGLKRFVDACHALGLAVVLDVVYNHLGPEGNYLREFGPYFTDRYRTPWGEAVNFDGPHSDGVRDYFIHNALHWFDRYHIDGLRLDAVHAIHDMRPKHILGELAEAARDFAVRRGRSRPYLIAETHANDPRLATPLEVGGLGMDAFWSDDFHHGLHTLLTGERQGYYMDYGGFEHLADAVGHGFAYRGEYSAFRKRRHGLPADYLPGAAFVVSAQTHDQIGNRMHGERLSGLVSFEALKLAAGLLLLTPYLPMLFMGEEWGEDNPFPYFISHGDPELVEAVRQGRKREFASFQWGGEPPDPQSRETFHRAVLDWDKRRKGSHALILAWHTELLRLRRSLATLAAPDRSRTRVFPLHHDRVLALVREAGAGKTLCLFNCSGIDREAAPAAFLPPGDYGKTLDSTDPAWGGPGPGMPEGVDGPGLLRGFSVTLYHGKATTS